MIIYSLLKNKLQFKNDFLSGITVALALIPEAIAFAFVAGVNPLVGLYAATIVGFITAVFGGRPGMISGATGALAVIMVSLVANHGVDYLFATVILMGLIQIIVAIFNLGRFIKIVPHPAILGFVNGLAIVIFIAQLGHFKTGMNSDAQWLAGNDMFTMVGLVALTMFLIYFLPKLTKLIPSALGAILIVFSVTYFMGIDTKTVGDLADISGGLPNFYIPQVILNWEFFAIVFPYAIILASVGLIESLLTLSVVDEITDTKGDIKKECFAQGGANVVTGFFGGMGGCAMIGQSIINVTSGGRSRVSGVVASLGLLFFIMFASDVIKEIPIASLVGVMFMVVIGTFAWNSIKILHRIPKVDAFVVVVVTIVTVLTDLAIAVFTGVIISALAFAWKSSQQIVVNKSENSKTIVYKFSGLLFFGSVDNFKNLIDYNVENKTIKFDFKNCRLVDHSSIEAVDKVFEKLSSKNNVIKIVNISPECSGLFKKASNSVLNTKDAPIYEVV